MGIGPEGFVASKSFVVGTVGRMEAVKDQLTLVRAFLHLVQDNPDARERMRLVMIGDGSLRRPAKELLRKAKVEGLAWLPGERRDVAEIMRAMDLFVLPSLRVGISNTILEAMATGLPVVATEVGGNPELVNAGETGELVPHSNAPAMAKAITNYSSQPEKARDHGRNARRKVEREFSMEAMVNGYLRTYDNALHQRPTERLREHSSTSSNKLIQYFEWTEVQFGDCLLGLLLEPGFHDFVSRFSDAFQLSKDSRSRVTFPFIKSRRNRNCQILAYHRVNDDADMFFPGIPVKRFEQQMSFLAEHFTVCPLKRTGATHERR